MTLLFIGLIVGITMGLTGAGGAMIAIPLFIHLLETSIKEATILSLLAVLLGTGINLFSQFSKIVIRTALILSLSGSVANYLSLPLKKLIPETGIVLLLAFIGAYSIVNIWRTTENKTKGYKTVPLLVIVIVGAFIGLLTTITGLGGGVILIPLLILISGKSYEEVVPTSLATIFLISTSSFILQFDTAKSIISLAQFPPLAGGTIIAAIMLKLSLKKISKDKILLIRRALFTLITVFSIFSVILKLV